MKDMTKEDWKKECRYLYKLLEEVHKEKSEYGIAAIDMHLSSSPEEIEDAKNNIWKVYCIENNIKPEDYET